MPNPGSPTRRKRTVDGRTVRNVSRDPALRLMPAPPQLVHPRAHPPAATHTPVAKAYAVLCSCGLLGQAWIAQWWEDAMHTGHNSSGDRFTRRAVFARAAAAAGA